MLTIGSNGHGTCASIGVIAEDCGRGGKGGEVEGVCFKRGNQCHGGSVTTSI